MIIRRAAAGLAGAAVAIALLGAGSASAEPMKYWSDCGVTVAVSEATTYNPMRPWSCNEHGPVAPEAQAAW
ncbi:hypothetical protein [Umezawaea sp. Da 62-37]|uniref:hypothetical protein n=1 Tax=Umezawaea sp. Da 62-37 TaxID=3075927 RepID=UPI0028F6DFE4|nr:hypothetical protein [Umezawaea sp. Da 62-37]WNV84967.1 hypothetical protein RM788_43565 [Umezawaea sp. Da 62-37]